MDNDKVQSDLKRSLISTVLCCIVIFLIGTFTNVFSVDRMYTYETEAILVDVQEHNYLYAPYHGGRVTEETEYNHYYTFEYDNNSYVWIYTSHYPVETDSVTLKIKDETPIKILYDRNDFTELDAEEPVWRICYNFYKYEE